MARITLVNLLLLMMMLSQLLLFSAKAKPWWTRRRRCPSNRPLGVAWVNDWKQKYFSTHCSSSLSIRYWHSQHRNCKEDRIHYFGCSYGPVPYHYGNCAWSAHYVNDYDQPVNFKCPHNGFITGVQSSFGDYERDRRFGFRCCHVSGYKAHTCKITPYQNNWDQDVNYWVPYGYYLVGIYSVHHNYYEDRRWKFEVCQFSK